MLIIFISYRRDNNHHRGIQINWSGVNNQVIVHSSNKHTNTKTTSLIWEKLHLHLLKHVIFVNLNEEECKKFITSHVNENKVWNNGGQQRLIFTPQNSLSCLQMKLRVCYMRDSPRLSFSNSLSCEMSLYGFFLSFSSRTEFPISTSLLRSSFRDRNSTMPAPIESPKTLVVVRRRSLRPGREQRLEDGEWLHHRADNTTATVKWRPTVAFAFVFV